MCSMKLQHIQSLLKMDMLTSLVPGSLTLLSNRKSICTLIVDFPIRYVGFLDDTFFLSTIMEAERVEKMTNWDQENQYKKLGETHVPHDVEKKSIWFRKWKKWMYIMHFPLEPQPKKLLSCGTNQQPPFLYKNAANFTVCP